jgi:hypothetical protein
MKKFMSVVLALVFGLVLSGCDIQFLAWGPELPVSEYAIRGEHRQAVEALSSIEEVFIYVNTHVSYKTDEGWDDWQTPQTTLDRGTGDCEDFAILTDFLLNYYVGVRNVELAMLVKDDGKVAHMVIKMGGNYYETIQPWLGGMIMGDSGFGQLIDIILNPLDIQDRGYTEYRTFTLNEALHISYSGAFRGLSNTTPQDK